jgi:type II secretory pathway pseudopilin PulG
MRDRQAGVRGFSLIELLAAMVSGAVLALTVGLMLVYAFAALSRGQEAAELQRDASTALQLAVLKLRGASEGDVTEPAAAGDSGSILTLYDESTDGTVRLRDAGGGVLEYDPDTGTANDELILADGTLTAFTATRVEGGVVVRVQLALGEATADVEALARFRN